MKNFKDILAPIQGFMLKNGQCVGCGQPLKNSRKTEMNKSSQKAVCKCGRIYVFSLVEKKYRRALLDEI